MKLRKALIGDIPFLLKAVTEAETMPNGLVLYETLLGLEKKECQKLLFKILKTPGGGFQLSFDSFFLLVLNDKIIATCAGWVEGSFGRSSSLSMASVWHGALGERWEEAQENIRCLGKAHHPRTKGALQLETFYVIPEYRGRGITKVLIEEVIRHFRENQIPFSTVEIEYLESNNRAAKAYRNAGFSQQEERIISDPLFHSLTASKGFIKVVSY